MWSSKDARRHCSEWERVGRWSCRRTTSCYWPGRSWCGVQSVDHETMTTARTGTTHTGAWSVATDLHTDSFQLHTHRTFMHGDPVSRPHQIPWLLVGISIIIPPIQLVVWAVKPPPVLQQVTMPDCLYRKTSKVQTTTTLHPFNGLFSMKIWVS